MDPRSSIVVRFAPQHWGEIDRFHLFFGQTAILRPHERETLEGVGNHFRKAIMLLNVALSIGPRLEEDDAELKANGYSPGLRSAEFAAVVESALTAFYSSLDCTRKILNLLYPKAQGLPDSTRKTFRYAKEGKIGDQVPQAIRDAFAQAEWFPALRIVRDSLTHTNTGFCSRDRDTGLIRYFSEALKGIFDKNYIDDFLGYVMGIRNDVNEFQGRVFREFNRNLPDNEAWVLCGVFYARIYHRFVRPNEAVDFNSGRCGAYEWFELPENPTCPFVDSCGAYQRRAKSTSATG